MATENKNLSEYDKNQLPNAKDFRFGIVVSEWNDKITNGLFNGAESALLDCGVLPENIIRWNVPGSFELIYGAKSVGLQLLSANEQKTLGPNDSYTYVFSDSPEGHSFNMSARMYTPNGRITAGNVAYTVTFNVSYK